MWDNFKQSVINEVLERGGTGKYLKKITPKGERAVKPVISYTSEKWVLKIGFLKVQNW